MPNNPFIRYLLRILLGLVLGVIVVAGYAAYLSWTVGQRTATPVIESVPAAPAFALVDQNGRTFTNADLAGKVWVASFVFTHCPDVCDTVMSNMAELQQQLAEEGLLGDDVMLVSFTVDPLADTPEVLFEYATEYGADHAAWRFLTGPTEAVKAVLADGFFVPTSGSGADNAPSDYAAHHATPPPYAIVPSQRLVVVDQFGKVQGHHDSELPSLDLLMHELRFLVETG